MSQIPHTSPFDGIRHEDEDGKEYWSARELYKLLGYATWQKFQNAIEQAKIACENSEPARGPETSYLSLANVNLQCEAS